MIKCWCGAKATLKHGMKMGAKPYVLKSGRIRKVHSMEVLSAQFMNLIIDKVNQR